MKYLYSIVAIAILLVSCSTADGPTTVDSEGNLNWLKIEQLEAIPTANKKPVLVDVYTDWCGWCKRMDKNTFQNDKVKEYLKDKYYVVKFNAEQKEPIEYRGKTYNFVKNGRRGANELAAEMLNGRLGYPTIVYLDKDLNVVKASPGYKKPDQLIEEIENLKS